MRWFVHCDADTLLFEVEQISGACHTGFASCFFQELDREGTLVAIREQKVFDPEAAYGS